MTDDQWEAEAYRIASTRKEGLGWLSGARWARSHGAAEIAAIQLEHREALDAAHKENDAHVARVARDRDAATVACGKWQARAEQAERESAQAMRDREHFRRVADTTERDLAAARARLERMRAGILRVRDAHRGWDKCLSPGACKGSPACVPCVIAAALAEPQQEVQSEQAPTKAREYGRLAPEKCCGWRAEQTNFLPCPTCGRLTVEPTMAPETAAREETCSSDGGAGSGIDDSKSRTAVEPARSVAETSAHVSGSATASPSVAPPVGAERQTEVCLCGHRRGEHFGAEGKRNGLGQCGWCGTPGATTAAPCMAFKPAPEPEPARCPVCNRTDAEGHKRVLVPAEPAPERCYVDPTCTLGKAPHMHYPWGVGIGPSPLAQAVPEPAPAAAVDELCRRHTYVDFPDVPVSECGRCQKERSADTSAALDEAVREARREFELARWFARKGSDISIATVASGYSMAGIHSLANAVEKLVELLAGRGR
jgi:hypothetical protein